MAVLMIQLCDIKFVPFAFLYMKLFRLFCRFIYPCKILEKTLYQLYNFNSCRLHK